MKPWVVGSVGPQTDHEDKATGNRKRLRSFTLQKPIQGHLKRQFRS
jgi:hypothetical protein